MEVRIKRHDHTDDVEGADRQGEAEVHHIPSDHRSGDVTEEEGMRQLRHVQECIRNSSPPKLVIIGHRGGRAYLNSEEMARDMRRRKQEQEEFEQQLERCKQWLASPAPYLMALLLVLAGIFVYIFFIHNAP